MSRIFLSGKAFEPILNLELESVECPRGSHVIDVIDVAVRITITAEEDCYRVKAANRFDSGSAFDMDHDELKLDYEADINLDDYEDGTDKLMVIAVCCARKIEKYMLINNVQDVPEQDKGGILAAVEADGLVIRPVIGADRPEMRCFTSASFASGHVESTMGRPYSDEVMEKILAKTSNMDTASDSASDDSESDESDDTDSMLSFAKNMPRIFLSMEEMQYFCDKVTDLLKNGGKSKITDVTLAIEVKELPYTLVYTNAEGTAFRMLKSLDGLQVDDKTDAALLIFKRMDFGTYSGSTEGAVASNIENNQLAAGARNQMIVKNLPAFYRSVIGVTSYLLEENLYDRYSQIDAATSGLLIKLNDDTVSWKIVSGRERPTMKCLAMSGLFSEDIVDARPYSDETNDSLAMGFMSAEEKEEAAENGNVECMSSLAVDYLNGNDEISMNPQKSAYWFEKAAEAGDEEAMFNIGLYYAKGFGVDRDFKKAYAWMEKAAEAGDEDAVKVAETYKGMYESEEKAKAGDAQAQAVLAGGYMEIAGSLDQAGVGDDYAESFKWAQKSADQGNGKGIWTLALCYEHGRGVKEDNKKAFELFEHGAQLGDAACMQNLACYYMDGSVVKKDKEKGFELLSRSAELGNALAMKNLGHCYQFAEGTAGNMEKAVEWYEKSLEKLPDPELERKVAVFKMMGEADPGFGEDYAGTDDEDDIDTSNLPDGYMEELARVAAEEETKKRAEQEKIEAERKAEEARVAEEKRKAEEEERLAKEKQLAEDKEMYGHAMSEYRKKADEVNKQRGAYVNEQIEKKKAELISAATDKKNKEIAECDQKIKELESKKSDAEATLQTLGIFKGKQKKECRATIENCDMQIQAAEKQKSAIETTCENTIKMAPAQAAKNKSSFEITAGGKFPMPQLPDKPESILAEERAKKEAEEKAKREAEEARIAAEKAKYAGMTRAQIENLKIRETILNKMIAGKAYTIEDMVENFNLVNEDGDLISNQRISAIIRQLVLDNLISREEIKRKAYFTKK